VANERASAPLSSISTIKVFLPVDAAKLARALANVVFPTPPLPVTKSRR
jgi:hypothetical protein